MPQACLVYSSALAVLLKTPVGMCAANLQATSLEKLNGLGPDKEVIHQQLVAVQQQVQQVKGENEELRTFFQEAVQVIILLRSSFSHDLMLASALQA